MKNFLAVYTGSASALDSWSKLPEAARAAREAEGMQAWKDWANKHAAHIVQMGSPLGRTKRAGDGGIQDTRNNLAAWTLIQAESHEAAAKLFENHPHFTLFPGDGVEIMECLPLPGM